MSSAGDLKEPLLEPTEVVPVSRNVYLIYGLMIAYGLADSIWSGAVLSAWLFILGGGDTSASSKGEHGGTANTVVGGIEAAQGMAGLLTALPVGYIADKFGRAIMCKTGGVGYILTSIFTIYVVSISSDDIESTAKQHTTLVMLGIAMTLWGIFGGIFQGPVQALFADSVPQGQRSKYYTTLQLCYMGPSIVGPGVAIILFQLYGNSWTIAELKAPFLIGLIMEIPAGLIALFLKDEHALEEKEEKEVEEKSSSGTEDEIVDKKRQEYVFCGIHLKRSSIPFVLFFSDMMYALGSGMTIKFFPLYFMKEVQLSPSAVQTVGILARLLLMLFTFLAQRVSVKMGRVQTVVSARTMGISFLLLLAVLALSGEKRWFVIVPIYLFRTAIMNCCYPLDESILMDNVKKSERSRWKSLESVTVFGWTGSALVGGILADKFSYDFTFIITAIFQATGCALYMLLIPLVMDEAPVSVGGESTGGDEGEDSVPATVDAESGGKGELSDEEIRKQLVEPLLANEEE